MTDRWRRNVTMSYSKNAIVKKKSALRYVCGQERFCRASGLAQRITPAMLNLRAKGGDMHRVLKGAMTTWAAHANGRALAPFLETRAVNHAYFSPRELGRYHDDIAW